MFEDVHYDAQAKGGTREAARRQVTCLPGISVATDCESCMQWHIEQAVAAGASEAEVLESVEVGIEMAGGPGTVSARFALEVMDSVFPR